MQLFHATSSANLAGIMALGLNPGSYWTNDAGILDYYKETIEDDGATPVVLSIGIDTLIDIATQTGHGLEPDIPGVEEPISTVIGKSDEAIWSMWSASRGTWQDSLSIIGSLRCRATIPAAMLTVLDLHDMLAPGM
jgi:hypothetical protein